ncbi:cyclic nucleotide-binding domain-containing protein [Desulfurispira natronophila]|uniref:CRP-like cAMP-binding protein n=1 Tax=Desulfurispira natronophila TaxID=682562 RepID=A0A7W8DGS3_9BACT|nr:cyclic nucleotide-binding domain-containing protein [Desulfurispira natronophila]MBB5021662.1 CRP-like cAMP-binding protein [Desulfurispira natronophila]
MDRDGILATAVRTKDIKHSLEEISQRRRVPWGEMQFSIQHVSELKRAGDRFFREYEIEVFRKGLYPIELSYHIQQNIKDGHKDAYLTVKDDTIIDFSIATPLELLGEIKKAIAMDGIVFGVVSDELLYSAAQRIFQAAKERKTLCPEPVLIARGQSPKNSEPPLPVQYHFDKQGVIAKGKTEGETYMVREGEVLVTESIIEDSDLFITPHGSIVLPGNVAAPVFHDTAGKIRRKEAGEEIRYIAETDGYLSIEKGILTLRQRSNRPEDVTVAQKAKPQKATETPVESPPTTQEDHEPQAPAASKPAKSFNINQLSDAQKTLLKVKKLFSLFENLSNDDLLLVTSDARIMRYSKFDIVFEQGSRGKEIYFIINGSIDVLVGKKRIIGNLERYTDHFTASRLRQGAFFGEMTPITGERRSARCICSSAEAVLLRFRIVETVTPKNAMQMAVLYKNFVKALAVKLQKSNEAISQS